MVRIIVKAGDDVAMRTWYVRDEVTGLIDPASLLTSLDLIDEVWAEHGPFDGVLGR
jgi:hypothetical protein